MTVITFHSTYFALAAEKAIKKAGLGGKLIPVPRQISTSCGTALRLAEEESQPAIQVLEEAGIEIDQVHQLPEKAR